MEPFHILGSNFQVHFTQKEKKTAGNLSEINMKLHILCAEYKELKTVVTIDTPENTQSPCWILLLGYKRFNFYLCQ